MRMGPATPLPLATEPPGRIGTNAPDAVNSIWCGRIGTRWSRCFEYSGMGMEDVTVEIDGTTVVLRVAAIIVTEGKVLMSYDDANGYYFLPGGRV